MTQPYPASLPGPTISAPARAEGEPRRVVALGVLLLAAFCAVITFLPPEGRIGVPLHDGLENLLGRVSFMLPLGLAFVGLVLMVSTLRPDTSLPRRRLLGIGLLAIGVPPSEHLLGHGGDESGFIGRWLSAALLDLVGGPATLLILVAVLGLGTWLAFGLRLARARRPGPDAES